MNPPCRSKLVPRRLLTRIAEWIGYGAGLGPRRARTRDWPARIPWSARYSCATGKLIAEGVPHLRRPAPRRNHCARSRGRECARCNPLHQSRALLPHRAHRPLHARARCPQASSASSPPCPIPNPVVAGRGFAGVARGGNSALIPVGTSRRRSAPAQRGFRVVDSQPAPVRHAQNRSDARRQSGLAAIAQWHGGSLDHVGGVARRGPAHAARLGRHHDRDRNGSRG